MPWGLEFPSCRHLFNCLIKLYGQEERPRDHVTAKPKNEFSTPPRQSSSDAGTAGARMQEIAEEAGVNQALLHYYFRSKEKLAGAVFRETAGRMFPALIQIAGVTWPSSTRSTASSTPISRTCRQRLFSPATSSPSFHHHPERIPQLLGRSQAANLTTFARPAFDKLDKQLAAEAAPGECAGST